MKKQIAKKTGITLIALIITIIVLLILAGVTINVLVGDNGVVSKAMEASEKANSSSERELIETASIGSLTEESKYKKIDFVNFRNLINKQFEDDAITLKLNGNNSAFIKINNTDRFYYVDDTGKVLSNDEVIKISTANDLKAFRDDVNNGNSYSGKVILLIDNITLNINEEWEAIGTYPMTSTSPTNTELNKPFSGIFDGNGFEINGMYINTTDKVKGLFGLVIGGQFRNRRKL
ncbi:MAG: hypothetical protein IJ867_08970 [Clostridia bacterium]|nr:hypothetical protein [Clostridia bacterium]